MRTQETTTSCAGFQGTNTLRMHKTDSSAIRELFLDAHLTYERAQVIALLGISDSDLAAAMTSGVITPSHDDRGTEVILWEDVAHLALEQWTPRMIHAVLGDDGTPFWNQQRTIRVSLPRHLLRLLDHLAGREAAGVPRNASDILERILHDFANTLDTTIHAQLPGFSQALQYPSWPPHAESAQFGCAYCGSDADEEVCHGCRERHEPGTRP